MSAGAEACIGLGSNLGDRASLIDAALRDLDAHDGVAVIAASSRHETEPIGPPGQPAYLNAAAVVRTTLSPRGLLELCNRIERSHGRDRRREQRWGPRTLDLDILLYDDLILREPGLSVPHPRLHERSFVLGPLAEIAGGRRHPLLGRTIAELHRARTCPDGASGGAGIAPREGVFLS